MGCPNVETINAHQPNISADFLYQKHKLVLGKDITKLVILIPNEAHHGPHEDKEGRFIEQPFLPASAVVNVGTKVLWFNGDIGYKHTIIINKTGLQGSSLESMTNAFPNHEGSNSVTFDSLGEFEYSEAKKFKNKFMMRGKITVIKQTHSVNSATPIDTVGVLMVPAEDHNTYFEALKKMSFIVNSTHNFKNLSSKKKKVGKEQALLIWGTFEMDISQVMDKLREISVRLPYS